MAGDHKCPVCQATFTRPQHVARHMRSHTGDRPYKCQYCGDQFARSDLLSRHVNKCHATEKPLPSSGSRRKGSATRATTSKQVCDQCVQSSLPCDGCNPCAKCVQRKCRCTFIKFHRQTAPTGPGHHQPQPNTSSNTFSASSPSTHIDLYPPTHCHSAPGPENDFMLGHGGSAGGHTHVPATMADNFYTDSFSFGPLYPSHNSPIPTLAMAEGGDFSSRYRGQVEAFRLASEGGGDIHQHQHQHQHDQHDFQDHRASPAAWVGWNQDNKDLHHFMSTPSGTNPASTEIGMDYPLSTSFLGDRRRPSLDFSSSDGSSSSIPSSASSSSVHLPMEGIPIHQTFSGSTLSEGSFGASVHHQQAHSHHQPQQQRPPTDPADSSHPSHRTSTSYNNNNSTGTNTNTNPTNGTGGGGGGGGGFSSAFGLMSLDDPAVLAGLSSSSSDPAPFFSDTGITLDSTDPNATPMPMPPPPAPPPPAPAAQRPQQHAHGHGGQGQGRTPSKDELREFWKEYMRTPGPEGLYAGSPGASGNGIGNNNGNGNTTNNNGSNNNNNGTPGYRRPRGGSLPSVKTPTTMAVPEERFLFEGGQQQFGGVGGYAHEHQQHQQGQQGQQGPMASSKKYPLTHTHGHHPRHATDPTSMPAPAPAPAHAPAHVHAPPARPQRQTMHGAAVEDLRSYEAAVLARKAPVTLSLKPPRERRRGGGGGGGGVVVGSASTSVSVSPQMSFGEGQGQEQGYGRGSASPSIPSRESSVAVSEGSSVDGEGMRPSFKRLPSQTLGPQNTKRALVMRDGGDDGLGLGIGFAGGGEGGAARHEGARRDEGQGVGVGKVLTLRKDERPVVTLAERRRRMSVPATGGEGGAPEPAFALRLGALP